MTTPADPNPVVELRKAIEFYRHDDEPIKFTASDGTKYILTNQLIVRLLDEGEPSEVIDSEPDLSRGMWQIIMPEKWAP